MIRRLRRLHKWIQIKINLYHFWKGNSFLKVVYQEALELEFVYNLRESVKSADNMKRVNL